MIPLIIWVVFFIFLGLVALATSYSEGQKWKAIMLNAPVVKKWYWPWTDLEVSKVARHIPSLHYVMIVNGKIELFDPNGKPENMHVKKGSFKLRKSKHQYDLNELTLTMFVNVVESEQEILKRLNPPDPQTPTVPASSQT